MVSFHFHGTISLFHRILCGRVFCGHVYPVNARFRAVTGLQKETDMKTLTTQKRHRATFLFSILSVCALFACRPLAAQAAPPLVVDEADVLSAAQERELSEKLEAVSEKHTIDVVVYTVPDLYGKDALDYADDVFVYDDYGTGHAFVHSHTYAGNPLGCAAALAVQRVLEEQHVLETVAQNAKWLTAELAKTFGAHPNVGEIRHIGLIHAIELVKDPATKEPLDARRRTGYAIYKKALSLGLVLRPLGDVLYFNPPLNITREELSLAIEMAHEAVTAVLPEG